jgi:hypothetical protein
MYSVANVDQHWKKKKLMRVYYRTFANRADESLKVLSGVAFSASNAITYYPGSIY